MGLWQGQAFSINYFNDVEGEMKSLNYVTSILLHLRLDEKERYIISKTDGYKDGKSLIWALSRWIKIGKKRRSDYITPKEL